ncbi:interleukin-13 [Dasypus novemcinctus]|uniref:interleukin-13 n=1 Tax=Dasypus novemcinctus TaxID=9361 RepID=UPI00265DC684|nr:interleukin-13 [Dasypus novemcinctus]
MALWLTVVLVLACFGGLASPEPAASSISHKELIQELLNITEKQKAPLCNGSMVWSANLTGSMYCAALEALSHVSNCSAIQRTQRILRGLCKHKAPAGQISSLRDRHTKIEVSQFIENLLSRSKQIFRHQNPKA